MGTDLVNNHCSYVWQNDKGPLSGGPWSQGGGRASPTLTVTQETTRGQLVCTGNGPNPLGGRQIGLSTMTHEGDYVVLFIAKNKNF